MDVILSDLTSLFFQSTNMLFNRFSQNKIKITCVRQAAWILMLFFLPLQSDQLEDRGIYKKASQS